MIAIIFEQFGPYHHARVAALQVACTDRVVPAQMASQTAVYQWSNSAPVECSGLVTLCPGRAESLSPWRLFFAARRFFVNHGIKCALLPSYAPATSLAVLLAAVTCGVRRVMMNESHEGTERARGAKRLLKKFLVSLFDGGLVGGQPQMRHFAKLGMRSDRMVTGYDAIDNEYFTAAAARARADAVAHRLRLGLPERYMLSLGRLVEKKNLVCLVEAYSVLRQRLGAETPALVFVGSGDQESVLRERCARLGLKVVDAVARETDKAQSTRHQARGEAAVFFFGFRQIEENPIFYALAEAFVLPSLYEEWGLVVNEAMACGLPVMVSRTVGSAEDLVAEGVNGFQFDPASPAELAEKLAALAESPELRASMGEASRERIKSWGCENFAAKAREICETVIRD